MGKILYKSLPEDKAPHGHKFRKGKWYKVDGKLKICKNGYHASENTIDAMGYIVCAWIAKVEVRGESIIEDDKQCWSEMKILEWCKWTKKDSVSLVIFAVELVLKNYENIHLNNKRLEEIIEVLKKILEQDIQKNRSAIESASWAIESVEFAAELAAESAIISAIESAVASIAYKNTLLRCHNFVLKRKFK